MSNEDVWKPHAWPRTHQQFVEPRGIEHVNLREANRLRNNNDVSKLT